MKYKGLEYKKIAEVLNAEFPQCRIRIFTEQTIKDFFQKSGALYEPYKKYEAEWDSINKEIFLAAKKAGMQILEKNFRLACETLSALLDSSADTVRISATKELLNRTVGKVKLPVAVSIISSLNYSEKPKPVAQVEGGPGPEEIPF